MSILLVADCMTAIKLTVLICLVMATTNGCCQKIDPKSVDFSKADSVAGLYTNHSLKDIRMLSIKLTKSLPTELEKFRSIYKWVCNNIGYDYGLYDEYKRKTERLHGDEFSDWNKKFSKRVLSILLNRKVTVCTGYAYLVKELSFHAGILCKVVDGYGRNSRANIRGKGLPNHSWNAVMLNNEWYLCDPTWSSGAIDTRISTFVQAFDDSYFLADPELFIRNHYPLDSSMMLLKNKPSLGIFLNSPLLYTGAYKSQVRPLQPGLFNVTTQKGEHVTFQFSSKNKHPVSKVELNIGATKSKHPIHTTTSPDGSIVYSVDHTFLSKGTYAVHLLVEGNYAFTYEVCVK